jgi:excinuclease ABC subunit B
LVGILDADKQGFLRSKRSLVQTVGRAARHLHGKAIMYADVGTEAIQYTLDETSRRREIQEQFNKDHNITPSSVKKAVTDILQSDYKHAEEGYQAVHEVAEKVAEYEALSPKKFAKKLDDLEKQMHTHAKNLEFEEAAKIRNQIEQIQRAVFTKVLE